MEECVRQRGHLVQRLLGRRERGVLKELMRTCVTVSQSVRGSGVS